MKFMQKIGVFSIVSKNYLAYARVLFDSLKEIHPEYMRYLCLADSVGDYFEPEKENFELVEAARLGIPHFQDMTLREITVHRPRTLEALGRISGIGQKKLERYGESVLELVMSEGA